MKKKLLAIFLAALMTFCFIPLVSAALPGENGFLQFDENGKFTILNICDIQDTYPIHQTSKEFIEAMIDKYNPDLVILGGDNTVGPKETKKEAIKELCSLFTEKEVYFTFVFGNHDHEQDVNHAELFNLYKFYGGKYCLAYDADESLSGTGTHNLLIKSSDGTKFAYNLYMFDSGSYSYNENNEKMGYDCVHPDQIEWYKNTSKELAHANGDKLIPAMAFQHIIVQEIYDAIFQQLPPAGPLTRNYDGKSFALAPDFSKIKKGTLNELPCCGYYNYGQFDAMVETGDIVAIFSGHDHINTFTVEKDGIDIVNTPGCTYYSYGNHSTRGLRVIELDEKDTSTYKTDVVTISEYVLGEGKALSKLGDINMFDAFFGVLGSKIAQGFISFLNMFRSAS